jgi:hypothetical protein
MKMSSAMIPFLLLSFVACQSESKKSNVGKKTDEVSTSTSEEESTHPRLKITKKRKTELKKDFSNFSIFKEDINSYKVNFEAISGHYTNAIVECAKGHFDREKELFFASFDESGFKASVELSISDKDPLDVEFECKVMDQDLELDDAKIHLRKSFVVSGIKNPYSLGVGFGPIETLVFEEGAMLLTEGVYLNIEAKEIISRGGEIVTFTEESTLKALDDQHGASGGIINIVTETAVGKLSVQLRGKNAGKQTRVPEVMKEIPGKDLALDGTCKGDKQDYSDKDQRCFGKRGHQGFKGNKGYKHAELHEAYLQNPNPKEVVEWDYFINFVKDHPDLKPYRTEWTIYDEDLKISGSIDMIYENSDGTLSIYDWKRSKDITRVNNFNKFAINKLICHMPDANFWHYALQLNTYKRLIERKYGKTVTDLYLVRLHPDAEEKNYELIKLPDLSKEIDELFEQRKQKLTVNS